jgi:Fe-S-cluster containining protein
MDYSTAIQHLIPFVMEQYDSHEKEATKTTNKFLNDYPNEKVSCVKGCGACCHFPLVPVTAGEAFVLLNRLLAEGFELKELAEKLFSYVEKYFEFSRNNGRLPFLDTDQRKFLAQPLACPFYVKENDSVFSGYCGIFSMRPFICEFYNSIDSPKLCEQKLSHRSIEQVIGQGSLAQDSLREFERKIFGRSTIGHLPLLLAALCTKEGLEYFLNEKHLSELELQEDYAQGIHDFSLYAEMLNSIGYSLGENDLLALEQAQSEMAKDCFPT